MTLYMLVTNRGEHSGLIYEGEDILGARRNRTFDASVLVPPGVKLTLPVSCVEAGRVAGVSVDGRSGDYAPGEMGTRVEELRDLPQKDWWTPEESLALYEIDSDGEETVQGVPVPQYVESHDDRVRWSNAVRVGSQATGEPATGILAIQMARTMFLDRETYT